MTLALREIEKKHTPFKSVASLESDKKPKTSPLLIQKKCTVCGHLSLLPTGSCYVCQVCGSTSGCS